MRDALGPGTTLGYCTNVHAGASLAEARLNLARHAIQVKARVSPEEPMGIGWWLSDASARELEAGGDDALRELRAWLSREGLLPFTLNGFPFGDFHQPVVKHRVYQPDWSDRRRREYTRRLADLLVATAPGPCERSISTLPIGWPGAPCDPIDPAAAAANLARLAADLHRTHDRTGVLVHLDLEPEPGCILQRSADVPEFFERHLLPAADAAGLDRQTLLRHVRVCHDVCHASVMFEPQAEALARYRDAGIAVGKVQLSSAVRIDFDAMPPRDRLDAAAQLRAFAEVRYLHQTVTRDSRGTTRFFEDLPHALDQADPTDGPRGEWRVHFHVPLFLESFGAVATTQADLADCLRAIEPTDGVHHYEIETYAWDVLPEELRAGRLADGIAREMEWTLDLARRVRP